MPEQFDSHNTMAAFNHDSTLVVALELSGRRIVMQLAWRWLRFQPQSVLAQWFATRTGGAKGRIRTVMIVALARKLLVALWRYVGIGELPAGARVTAA